MQSTRYKIYSIKNKKKQLSFKPVADQTLSQTRKKIYIYIFWISIETEEKKLHLKWNQEEKKILSHENPSERRCSYRNRIDIYETIWEIYIEYKVILVEKVYAESIWKCMKVSESVWNPKKMPNCADKIKRSGFKSGGGDCEIPELDQKSKRSHFFFYFTCINF